MSKRPLGVTLVAVLTLLSSGALWCLFMVNCTLLVVGGPYGGASGDWLYTTIHYPTITVTLVFLVYSFFLSICMFTLTTKYVWYASILFWILLLSFFSSWAYTVWRNIGTSYNQNGSTTWEITYAWQYEAIMVTLLPFAYSIGCLTYFLKQKTMHYFNL